MIQYKVYFVWTLGVNLITMLQIFRWLISRAKNVFLKKNDEFLGLKRVKIKMIKVIDKELSK